MKKEKLQQLGHLAAGVIILVDGFDSFEHHEYLFAGGYLTLAIIFLLVAGLHTQLNKRFRPTDLLFFLIESVTIFYSAWHYKSKGHLVYFYLFAAAAVLFFIFACLSFPDKEGHKKHRSGKHKRRHSSSHRHHRTNHSGSGAGNGLGSMETKEDSSDVS